MNIELLNTLVNKEKFDKKMIEYKPVRCPETYTVPENDYTLLDQFKESKNYVVYDEQKVEDDFNDLCNDNCRVSRINGNDISVEEGDPNSLYCDYCETYINTSYYYFCNHCYSDMCSLCFEEKTEEIALSNGAKNYHKRKDALQECFTKDQLQKREFICLCDLKEENKEAFDNFDYYGFGSLLDYVPLIRDEEGDSIRINCNKESKNYGKICLTSVDNHGREGYFVSQTSLKDIIDELIEYEKEGKYKECDDGWERFYYMPIKKIMVQQGMTIHYG